MALPTSQGGFRMTKTAVEWVAQLASGGEVTPPCDWG